MIWDRALMGVITAARYRVAYTYADEFAYRDRDQLLLHLRRTAADGFVFGQHVRYGVVIHLRDVEVRDEHQPILTRDGQSTNVTRYIMNARWTPTSHEVEFMGGPIAGKIWQIEPSRIGQPIVALEAPVEPWFANDGDEEYVPRQIIYQLDGWDDFDRRFIYRTKG